MNVSIDHLASLLSPLSPNLQNSCHVLTTLFLAKQTVRPDSFYESVSAAWPSIKQATMASVWKITYCYEGILGFSYAHHLYEQLDSLEILYKISTGKMEEPLDQDANQELFKFFTTAQLDSHFLYNLQCLMESKHQHLHKFCNQCKLLLEPLQENFMTTFVSKIDAIKDALNLSLDQPLPAEKKFQPKDYGILFYADSQVKILEFLKSSNVDFRYRDVLLDQWKAIKHLNQTKEIQLLRQICLQECSSGKIFLGNRMVRLAMSDTKLNCMGIFKQLAVGQLNHLAIFVEDSKGNKCLSHVQEDASHHTIHPVKDPLYFAFFNLLELDISALIPKEISEKDVSSLIDTFQKSFEIHAKKEYPEVPCATFQQHLRTFFSSPKTISRHSLTDVSFQSGQPELCSSYVAKVFLQAIAEVNVKIKELGYTTVIPHPFGEHEALDRMDCLRLIYHWKRHQICRIAPIHPTIGKVVQVTQWKI